MRVPITKAKAIDLKKDKIVLAGLALFAGLMAMAVFSSSAHSKGLPSWQAHSQGEDEVKVPFLLNSQTLSH